MPKGIYERRLYMRSRQKLFDVEAIMLRLASLGESHNGIATLFGVAPATVNKYIHRARIAQNDRPICSEGE